MSKTNFDVDIDDIVYKTTISTLINCIINYDVDIDDILSSHLTSDMHMSFMIYKLANRYRYYIVYIINIDTTPCLGHNSHPGGVNDSHSLSTTETEDKLRSFASSWLGFNFYTRCRQVGLFIESRHDWNCLYTIMYIIIFLNIAKSFFFSLNLLFETILKITYICIQSRRYYKIDSCISVHWYNYSINRIKTFRYRLNI